MYYLCGVINQKNMRYLVTTNSTSPFFTDWFDAENHFNSEIEMVVYDLSECKFTSDGKTWNRIEIDHL
jgi:hypothetical protein